MAEPETNPLVDLDFELPFDRIRAEHVEPAIDTLVERTRRTLDGIGAATDAPTYDNTLGALEASTEPIERAMTVVGHLEGVATTEALRAAYNTVRPKVQELFSSIPLDEGLYARLKAFAETDEAKALPATRARFLEQTLREFRRHGAELDEAGKARLRELDVELAKLTTEFAQNLLDETNAFQLVITDESKLAGLPESARDAARASAESKGVDGWRFTLQAPSLIAILTHLEDASIRERVWRAYNTRASEGERNNRPLIARILELRQEKATLLGFEDFADFVLEERMAKSGADAQRFVADLTERAEPFFEKEKAELAAFRRELEGDDAPAIRPWDVGFYAEKLRKKRFDFDDEELRPYFPAERVLDGLFAVVERLYGVTVEPWEGCAAWNDDVRCYQLLDADGTRRGGFYVDLFPREDKRGGAWMNAFITGGPRDGGFAPHLGLFCANVTPPVGDAPALLTHAEVETLFHEFGHLMHHLLSEVDVRSLSGTAVAWDFVELPSQIMENWTWEREALDLFARHYQTDEPIPDALFEKMRNARTFRAANGMMRQLGFAHTDLALHVDYDPAKDGDPVAYAREKMLPFQPAGLPDDYAMICGFTHLFASPVAYAAGYYSYKWAEVLEADAFSRFREAGIFDRDVGAEFRDKILARGDSDDPDALFRDFMGRDPKVDALLERDGLVA
ncbi:MAG TPA: M3 family metallopeptidase [Sandaracinaceae bacterium LLY-WYZ-13_1]|nr:M3 family metallopeptidase [Sandaracinaceae bacterium LLY-WYZ-13_1]